ncbi:hypothetical protein ACOTB7_18865 [Achromobacter xylosoxidans]
MQLFDGDFIVTRFNCKPGRSARSRAAGRHVFVIVAIARTALDRAAHACRANFAQACQH